MGEEEAPEDPLVIGVAEGHLLESWFGASAGEPWLGLGLPVVMPHRLRVDPTMTFLDPAGDEPPFVDRRREADCLVYRVGWIMRQPSGPCLRGRKVRAVAGEDTGMAKGRRWAGFVRGGRTKSGRRAAVGRIRSRGAKKSGY